jgi:hypothetical protein
MALIFLLSSGMLIVIFGMVPPTWIVGAFLGHGGFRPWPYSPPELLVGRLRELKR